MKILLATYHNPNFLNTSVYREKAVEYLGHQCVIFDDRKFLLPGRLRQAVPWLARWDLQRLNDQLVNAVRNTRPDVCFSIGGHRILPQTVRRIKDLGVPIALWTTDAPVDFKNILEAAPSYDHLFCAGTEAREIFIARGLRNVTWVPFACDPAYHQPVPLNGDDQTKYGRDVVFVGSFYPNRAAMLETIADLDLGVWGPYWDRAVQFPKVLARSVTAKINYDQWVKIYSAAKITLVVHYQNPGVPCDQASPKIFEALACGAFVLVDDQKDARELFTDGKHVVFFRDKDDLRAKAGYYLDHPEERRRIAEEGRRYVIGNHRYQDRMQCMIEVLRSSGRLKG